MIQNNYSYETTALIGFEANISVYKYDQYFIKSNILESGVIYKKCIFKFIIAFNGEITENRLNNEVVSLVMEVNEITYKRC